MVKLQIVYCLGAVYSLEAGEKKASAQVRLKFELLSSSVIKNFKH